MLHKCTAKFRKSQVLSLPYLLKMVFFTIYCVFIHKNEDTRILTEQQYVISGKYTCKNGLTVITSQR